MAGCEGGEDLLRTLIARDPDGLVVVGRDDRVIRFANPAAAALLGRPGADLRGQPVAVAVAPASPSSGRSTRKAGRAGWSS